MRRLLMFLLLTFFSLVPTTTVFACSGPMQNIDDTAENAPIIVLARVVSSDERQENGIIQVETYLKGTGGEYLLLAGNTRGTSNGLILGRYGGGDCVTRNPYMIEGESYYLFLTQSIAGTYDLSGKVFARASFNFDEEEPTVQVYLNDEYQNIPESQLLEIISEHSDGSSTSIPNDRPLSAALRIITEAGTNYLLPVDGSTPIPLTTDLFLSLHNNVLAFFLEREVREACADNLDCFHFSPDFISLAIQQDINHIQFENAYILNGQSFLFSTLSDAIAIWNGNNLEIHTIASYWHDTDWRNPYEIIAQVNLNLADISTAEHAAWSPDGRLLAYSDADGLWLWDVFTTNSQPYILIPSENNLIPMARYFSPLGRFLAIQRGDEFEYFDIISGQFLPNGTFSPNERYLIVYDTTATLSTPSFCTVSPFECRELDTAATRGIEWRDNSGLYAIWCTSTQEQEAICDLYSEDISFFRGYGYPQDSENPNYVPVRLFAYESENQLIATVRGEYVLNNHDLSAHLDSPIARIEWMPSFFYHEN